MLTLSPAPAPGTTMAGKITNVTAPAIGRRIGDNRKLLQSSRRNQRLLAIVVSEDARHGEDFTRLIGLHASIVEDQILRQCRPFDVPALATDA
jgi:hypothetical protein